jgi:hypothetical protein
MSRRLDGGDAGVGSTELARERRWRLRRRRSGNSAEVPALPALEREIVRRAGNAFVHLPDEPSASA